MVANIITFISKEWKKDKKSMRQIGDATTKWCSRKGFMIIFATIIQEKMYTKTEMKQ